MSSSKKTTRCALYGFVLVLIAMSFYVAVVLSAPLRWVLFDPPGMREVLAPAGQARDRDQQQ